MRTIDLNNAFAQLWEAAVILLLSLAVGRLYSLFLGHDFRWIAVSNFLVFAGYLMRFFLGNLRYLSDTFDSGRRLDRTCAARAICDFVLLLLHVLAFAGLALFLGDCYRFQFWLIALLLTDLWWLFYEPQAWPTMLRRCWLVCTLPSTIKEVKFPDERVYPPRIWIANNMIAAVAVMICFEVAGPNSCVLLNLATLLVGLLNSVADVRCTRLWIYDTQSSGTTEP